MTRAGKIPLLLTSSVVAHDRGVALKDTEERIRLTLESVQEWLRIDPELPIVLCDGSSRDFSAAVKTRFPAAAIECLFFENPQDLVRQHGRGFGEGEIVRHAIARSRFIAEAGCFAKCTSKLWVENFAECTAEWQGSMRFKAVFLDVFSPLRPTRLAYIDTRFYIISCEHYRNYFLDAHRLIRKEDGHGLEECFLEVFLGHGFRHGFFKVPPIIHGVGGGTGRYYRNRPLRILKEKLRLWLARRTPAYAQFF